MDAEVSSLFEMAGASLVLFCFCAYAFLQVLRKPVPVYNATAYTRSALRVKKAYGVFAWGLMTGTFLLGLVMSFADVYTQL